MDFLEIIDFINQHFIDISKEGQRVSRLQSLSRAPPAKFSETEEPVPLLKLLREARYRKPVHPIVENNLRLKTNIKGKIMIISF